MKCRLLVVGKCREQWLKDAIAEYSKRLSRYVQVEWAEIPDAPDHWPMERILQVEGEGILSKIRERDFVVLVDLHGQEMDSFAFARAQNRFYERSGSQVTWVIAGSNGFAESVRQRAQERICLSKLTFPHTMTRLILLEQMYRGMKITQGEPYHK